MGKPNLSTSKKLAMLITYGQIFTQTLCTFFLTKFYIAQLGEEAYGLYQMIYAVAQYILILDLGISTTMIRYITDFDTRDNHKQAENFAFHMLVLIGGLLVVIAGVGVVVNYNLGNIYPSCTAEEIELAHKVFSTMLVQICLTILCHYAQGISMAYDRYSYVKGVAIGQILIGAVLSVIFVLGDMGIQGIVRANTIVIFFNFLAVMIYDIAVLHFKPKFHSLDMRMIAPAVVLMFAMMLQSIVGYVNSSVDKTILGIMATKRDVTIYSVAATIITMFNALPTAVSSVFQPEAVRLVARGAGPDEIEDFVVKPGRFQFIITGGFIAGFALFGRDFITCWTGESTVIAWAYVLIILVPNLLPLIQNTMLAILNAKNRRLFRSLVLFGITGLNIGLTIVLIPFVGSIGAPIATGISYIIGHCVIMNIYYHKTLKLNIGRMFKKICKGILPCVLITSVVCLPIMLWKIEASWMTLVTKAAIFCVIYAGLLYKFGLSQNEKSMITSRISKLSKR